MSDGSFTDLLNKEFRWPNAGDRLFVSANQWWQNASVADSTFTRMVSMESGFKEAGDLLVDKTREDNHHRSVLIYPIIFCYRHSLELALKYIINMYGRAAGVSPNTKEHNLARLWPHCRAVIEYFDPKNDDPALDAVEACIAEFTKIDPGSDTFRYPTNSEGQSITINLPPVNLLELRDTMEAIHNFFTGVDGYIDHAISSAPDYGEYVP